ncbi:MAG TPA: hypothetical protein VF472_11125 [Burkholderiaceae bacterium]
MSILLSCAVVISCDVARAEVSTKSCVYDRARLLALDQNQFDQDMSGGWRALSAKPGCNLVAADLLHDYREAHHNNSDILFWHEAQLRAFAGQYQEAVALMERSYKPADADKAGWNPYVDATIAFLRKDRAALETAKSRLAVVQPPSEVKDMPPVVKGYMEIKFADGVTRKFRWPPNIDVIEGLENCFDKPYEEAYGEACRQSPR